MGDHSKVSITPLLNKLIDPLKGRASAEEIAGVLALIYNDQLTVVQCASFLTLLQSSGRGHDAQVVAKCSDQMRTAGDQIDKKLLQKTVRKRNRRQGGYMGGLCDIVGTGGDGHSTFNVSTTASILASSQLLICKHGAKASSSKSGSADMLQHILPKAPIIEAITATNIVQAFEHGDYAFLYAPIFNPRTRFVAPVRRALGFRTLFNILGPLANPADPYIEARIVGVAMKELGYVHSEALRLQGARKTMVVCGAEDLDEISCAGKTFCWRSVEKPNPEFRGPKTEEDEDYTTSDEEAPPRTLLHVEEFELHPEDFGFPPHPLSEVLPGQEPSQNAAMLMKILNNEIPDDDPVLHFVLMNTAALFVVSGLCDADTSDLGSGDSGEVITEIGPGGGRWKEGVRRARWAITSGAAKRSLEQYIDFTTRQTVP
ncbi:MAG: hypothetical protein GOMPHAMPRED_002019 [Gomphillus americanus]|uniref:Glycosyl transferase family 3 domain-containing protein n=1 Tax=Gomphillus americanus TaxID=1940652 RepID=A0A8H3FAV7_9LECA|nr:MAG: hypothetical protein GOMPHAMPRED_002019 [Gomphillus americanus]